MIVLRILRDSWSDEGTFSCGVMHAPGEGALGEWQFIELPWRDNARGISCIPAGVYDARLIQSPRFGRAVYLLENVPDRSAIEIHPANWAGDEALGFHSDLNGCLAPGMARGRLKPPQAPDLQPAVLQSAIALDELIDAANGEPMRIEIRWISDFNGSDRLDRAPPSPEGGG